MNRVHLESIVRVYNSLNSQVRRFKATLDMLRSCVFMAGKAYSEITCWLLPEAGRETYSNRNILSALKEILHFSSTLTDIQQSHKRPLLPKKACKWSISNRQKEDRDELSDIGNWQWRTEDDNKAKMNIDLPNLRHKIFLPISSSSLYVGLTTLHIRL